MKSLRSFVSLRLLCSLLAPTLTACLNGGDGTTGRVSEAAVDPLQEQVDAGAEPEPEPMDAGPLRYLAHIQPIFETTCAPCHFTNAAGGLRLDAGMGYAAMVGRAVRPQCNDGGEDTIIVSPGDAGHSALWLKVSDDPRKCGQRMPPPGNSNRPPLSAEDQARIRLWIEQGAIND
ncbi:MAG: hypothetical protein ACT4TC_14380 [Myxococcaceae bacterium]